MTRPARERAGAEPYCPTAVGELVLDARAGRVGVFMDRVGDTVHLRPERGGLEWEVDPRWLRPPPATLAQKNARRNGDSRCNSDNAKAAS
nr:hypothetical protein [Kitasatospora sp. MAP12-44]